MERKAFLDQEPPPGYIAGVGRGATGFTTSATSSGIAVGNGTSNAGNNDNDENSSDNENYGNEDEYDTSWASFKPATNDDELADKIYSEVDARISVSNTNGSAYDTTTTTTSLITSATDGLSADLANLKRGLADVTADQWASLPEAGDMTRRNKRTRLLEKLQQRYYAAPDALLREKPPVSDTDPSATNFELISSAKDALLGRLLDSLVPLGSKDDGEEEGKDGLLEENPTDGVVIADLQKSRQALASLRRAEPNKASSWIASARLELEARDYKRAKSLIVEGCDRVPKNEDVWLESIRIHQNSFESNKLCKRIAATALSILPMSSKLWLKSVDLENPSDVFARKRIVHKALLSLPHNGPLWKQLIELEDDPATVRVLLAKAVEMVPKEWDFRQALVDLSDYDGARKVLNSALKTMKDDYRVWVAAIKVEERAKGDSLSNQKLQKMVQKGMVQQSLAHLDLRFWLTQAAQAAQEGFHESSKAIVFACLEAKGEIAEWLSEADYFTARNETDVVQLIYEYVSNKQPENEQGWTRLLNSLKSGSHDDRLFEFYQKAVAALPENDKLSILFAMDVWKIKHDIDGARDILLQAASKQLHNQAVQLERINLEISAKDYEAAQAIFEEMVHLLEATSSVWNKYVRFARFYWKSHGDYKTEIILLIARAIDVFPNHDDLYLQKGEVFLQDLNDVANAREAYTTGTKKCPQSIKIWLALARLEKLQIAIRARSILDLALLKNPNSPELWTEKIRLEKSLKDMVTARSLANKALQLFHLSPIVWKEYVELIPKKSHQKNMLNDALKATNNSSTVLLMIGQLLWSSRKQDNAKVWYERALNSNPHDGDCWGWLYAYYDKFGKDEDKAEFLISFEESKHSIDQGECWLEVTSNIKNYSLDGIEILALVSKQLLESIEVSR